MAGTTTYYGISYPTATDYVKDGASAMQTIADGFDSAVAIPTYNNQTGTSYTFVLADAGKTVTSNNASAVTFTIPPQTSVAWANNTTLTVRNLGAGVVTIAGGAGVTVTNTAQTVAQYGSVRIIRTASNAWTVAPAGGTGGLTLVKTQTIGTAVSSVTVSDAFNSTYDAYKIIITSGAGSTDTNLIMQFGSTTSGYYYGASYVNYVNSSVAGLSGNNASNFQYIGHINTNAIVLNVDVLNPNLAKNTIVGAIYGQNAGNQISYGGYIGNTTQYTAFTVSVGAGNMTGGTIRVYGYQNS